nr:helix-turn-helix domain-containing protein [uncultured Allomuricauda sp.]
MNFSPYETIHILSIFIQLPLISVLLLKGRLLISNQIMIFFFLAQILYSVDEIFKSVSFYTNFPYLAYIVLPFYAVWGPSIYFYIKSESTYKFSFKTKYVLHYLPFILLTTYFLFSFHFQTIEEKSQLLISKDIFPNLYRRGFVYFIGLQVFIYNIFAIVTIEKFAKSYSIKDRNVQSKIKWNRFIAYGYFITCLFNNLAWYIFMYSSAKNTKVYLYVSTFLFLAYFSIILCKALLSSHFGEKLKSNKSISLSKEEYINLNSSLERYMKNQKPFLQLGLTLSDLASQLNTRERQLSQFINNHYNLTFQDYINSLRIEEAKKLIEQNRSSGKTILEIAYASGFNSKSAFNFAFKKHTQTTPTSYKRSLK